MGWQHDFVVQSNGIEGYYHEDLDVPQALQQGEHILGIAEVDPLYRDHMAALEFVIELAEAEEPLTEERVLEIHLRLCKEVMPLGYKAGEYRTTGVVVGGRSTPKAVNVRWMVQCLLDKGLPKVDEEVWHLHYAFEVIHPFRDGNGRSGRVLLVYWMIRAGLDPSTLKINYEERYEYYRQIEYWECTYAERFFGEPFILLL